MIRIAVTELEYRKAEQVFKQAEAEEAICLPAPREEAGLAAFIRANRIDHVIIGVDKYRNELYDALPRGGVIARFGVGHDGVDKALATEKGLLCTNTPGVLDRSVAECAIGLILTAARHFASCIADNKNMEWRNRVGFELNGKTLAVIGCGAIGRMTAAIARHGFGMRVVGFDLSEPKDRSAIDEFVTDFAAAVKDADYVTLHIPDIPATKNFIGRERLALLKSSAVLINTARGGVVDEDAVYDAVAAGAIAGAALDVFKTEPYVPMSPDKDLRTLDRVIMTPHIGSSTVEACNRMAAAALKNIRLAVAGRTAEMSLLKA